MRKIFLSTLIAILFLAGSVSAQLIGTKNIPGDYPTLDAAIIDLNTVGVGAGGVTLNVIAGNPETAPAGGYVITATGTAANPIAILGNLNVITASPALTAGALNDGIFKIIGGDFISIAQFTMQENPANTISTPAASNNMTEWGVALLYASATDGAQNNAIIGNTIALNRTYTNTFGIYSNTRHTSTSVTTAADITTPAGANSNNKIWTNSISNVSMGIAFIGSNAAANQDTGNDIGGAGPITGNTITNYGSVAGATSGYVANSGTSYCIYMNHQVGFNVSYNTITSASIVNTTTMRGIFENFSGTNPTLTGTNSIISNTIRLTSASTSSAMVVIDVAAGSSTLSRSINGNTIFNNALTGVSSASMTAIACAGTVNSLTIGGNVIRGNTSTSSGAFTGISNSGAVVTSITISGNQIGTSAVGAITYSVGGGAITGINNSGAASTCAVSISGNALQGFSLVSGAFNGILNSGGGNAIGINGNQLGTSLSGLLSYSAATSGAFLGISNTAGATGSSLNILGNSFSGITYAVAASSSNTYINQTSGSPNVSINGNTFNNLNVNTTGSITFISNNATHAANTTQDVNGNSIATAFTKGGAGGTVLFYISNSSSPTTVIENNMGNNFSNITCSGATTISGWQSTDGPGGGTGSRKTVTGNTFSNITTGAAVITVLNVGYSDNTFGNNNISNNTISNITGGSDITGIISPGGNQNIINNVVFTLSSTGGSQVRGIAITGGTTQNVFANKIYDLQANNVAGTVNGVSVTAATTVQVANNLIGDLRAPASDGVSPLNGINISGGTTVNVYYNTVRLNGTSTGTNFGSSGFNISTTPAVTLRNNLVVNLSTPNGTGLTVAHRRSSTTLSTFNNASNNNSYYAGTPSATNLIYSDGTNFDQTLAAYQIRVASREAASLSENPVFASLSGPSANFLHIAAATSTLLESGGAVIASLTTDYDNDARPGPVGSVNGGAIAPDIGADEFDGVLILCTGTPTAGTVSGLPLSRCVSGTFTLSATGASSGPGITYQWQESAVSGGPYTNIPGATTLTYTTASISATTYYVLVVTCTNSAQTVTSTQITASVFPNPVVGVTPTSGVICSVGATPVVLTASGATTYTWLPTTGLTPSTGSPVSAAPGATTTYTVTGTDVNGCTATATATVTIVETPSMVSVTATPASVCNNGNSQLLAVAANTTSYTQSTTTFAPINSGTGTITLCNATVATTALTNGNLDDGYWNNIAMPFTFNYFGSAFNSVSVQTNGAVSFSPFTTTTGYNVTMPAAAAPNNIIAACFGDLQWSLGGGGTISCYTSGTAPNRIFVINYNGAAGGGFYNSTNPPTALVVTQVQLFEGSNIIKIQSTNIGGVTTVNHAQGIENSGGTVAVMVTGRNNTASWTATNEGIQFVPSAGTFTYAWTPPTFLSSTTIANPMATNITATTTYTVVASAGGCSSAPGSVTITSGSLLSSTNSIAPSNTVCSGTNVTLGVTPAGGGIPYTYAWSGPNSYSSTSQNPVLTGVTTAESGTYTIVVTDNCGATSTTSVTLTVNSLPVVAVTPTTALYCNPGTPVSLTASGALTYAWGPAAGLSATTGSNVDATPAVTTTYTVTGTNGSGCIATATTTITSAPAVAGATASATLAAICTGNSTSLNSSASPYNQTLISENFNAPANSWTTINLSTGGTPANAAWTLRPNGYSPGGFWTAALNSNDNSQFYLTNADAQGSGSTANTILQSPAINTVGFATLNLSFFHYYRFNQAPDSAIVEVSTDGLSWTRVQFYTSPTVGTPTAFAAATINLNAYVGNPTLYIRFHYRAAWGYGWAIDNVSVIGGSNAFTYNWSSTPTGFTSTAQNPTSVGPTASSTYTVQITNAFGCSATANTSITVNPLPAVVANATATTVCDGNPVTLTGSGATSYTWTGSVTDNVAFNPSTTDTYTVTGTDANGCVNTDNITVTVNPLPTVVANSTATAVCAGSPVTLSGSGATSYTWTGSVTDNVAFNPSTTDTYTVTGTDANGCQNTDNVTVTVNPLPAVVANASSTAICIGDQVTLTGSGATSYTWTNSVIDGVPFSPTITDVYTVTGTDANGCQNTDNTSVTVNTLPTVVANATASAVCDGSPVTLFGSGAVSFAWTGSVSDNVAFTPAVTDTYTVTGTDGNGCVNTDNITVTVNTLPTVVANATATTICEGSPVTLSGSGASTYTWTGSVTDNVAFNPTVSDTYTVTGTDGNGCQNSDNITVTVNPLPVITISFPMDTICYNAGVITLAGASPAGGTWSGPGVFGSSFDPQVAGLGWDMITYSYTDANSCTGTLTDSINVDVCNGIAPVAFVNNVTVYPNPNLGQFTIELSAVPQNAVSVELTNSLGQLVDSFTLTSTSKQIDISHLDSGIYMIRVIDGNNISVHRVVKQ